MTVTNHYLRGLGWHLCALLSRHWVSTGSPELQALQCRVLWRVKPDAPMHWTVLTHVSWITNRSGTRKCHWNLQIRLGSVTAWACKTAQETGLNLTAKGSEEEHWSQEAILEKTENVARMLPSPKGLPEKAACHQGCFLFVRANTPDDNPWCLLEQHFLKWAGNDKHVTLARIEGPCSGRSMTLLVTLPW